MWNKWLLFIRLVGVLSISLSLIQVFVGTRHLIIISHLYQGSLLLLFVFIHTFLAAFSTKFLLSYLLYLFSN